MAKKVYVLDTNILMDSPDAVFGFEDNIVVITGTVLQELDKHKNDPWEAGYNTRLFIRTIERIVNKSCSADNSEFALENDGSVYLFQGSTQDLMPYNFSLNVPDNRILNDILSLQATKYVGLPIILVTNDVSMRLNARVLGIEAQSYQNVRIKTDEDYTGRIELDHKNKKTWGYIAAIDTADEVELSEEEREDFHENQFVILIDKDGRELLTRYRKGVLRRIDSSQRPMGVCPRNKAQVMAIDALTASVDEAPLAILCGPAGTAKTFLALAAGLSETYCFNRRGKYSKIIISRPNHQSDKDLGALPGDIYDKWMPSLGGPFKDNLEKLIAGETGEDPEQVRIHIEDLFESGTIEILPLAYIRGRSISDAYIIVDEAQNASRGLIADVVSRAGIGSKVVLLGDPNQIDNPSLDKRNNGLSAAMALMMDSELAVQLTFNADKTECVRSPLATEAVKRLVG